MKLSILICSLVCRADALGRLMLSLERQKTGDVEILTNVDDGDVTIGEKRNALLAAAAGEWRCFIDDDDEPSADYVPSILEALNQNPDCVGFRVRRMIDGHEACEAIHSTRYTKYGSHPHPYTLERTPNHLNPIRASIAMEAGFPKINRGEDVEYARRVRPRLTSEAFVDRVLYTYWLRRDKSGERRNRK